MSYIYLASPYTSRDTYVQTTRYRAACRAAASLMDRGELVFSPVVYGCGLENRIRQTFPYDYWIRWGKAFLAGASRLYVLTIPGWDDSTGIGIEVRLAVDLSIPVVGFAFGPDAEDVSGLDICGHFGVPIIRAPVVVQPIIDISLD